MPSIERGGATVFYEARGSGPAVALAHNIFCDRRVFDGVIARLGTRWRTLAVDLRGHGQSPVPDRPYDAELLAGDLAAVLDAERVERAAVVGLSMGATAALELALARPERVCALALLGATARQDDRATGARNALLGPLVRLFGVRGPILQKALTTLFGASYRAESPPELAQWRARISALAPRAAHYSFTAWRARRRFLGRLSAIGAPTLILAGDEDVACPLSDAEELHRGIRGATLVPVARAGHTMTVERPEAVAAALAPFLERCVQGVRS